jgi:hypothetical protein
MQNYQYNLFNFLTLMHGAYVYSCGWNIRIRNARYSANKSKICKFDPTNRP